jgi:beta-glucanase (GH16 family)
MNIKKILSLFLIIGLSEFSFAQSPKPPEGFRWVLFQQYSDEFNGNTLDHGKWRNSFPGWQGRPPAKFEPTAVTVENGTLQIKSGKYDTPQGSFTMYGGAVTSLKETAHYGYYEVKFKTSKIPMSTTFWLSNSKQPYTPTSCETDKYSQELDIVEAVGEPHGNVGFKTSMKSNTHHRYVACGASSETFYSQGATSAPLTSEVSADYHVYGAQWHDANSVTFYADGIEGATVAMDTSIDPHPFVRPMFMAMVTETYNWLTPYPTDAQLNNNAINTAYYDWVRSYRLVPIFDPEPETPQAKLVNGDFEFGNLENWIGWGNGIREVVTDNVYEGAYAAHIKGPGAHEQVVDLNPNTTYLLTCFAKIVGGKVILGVKHNSTPETVLGTKEVTNTAYEKTTLEFTTGTETNLKFYFFAHTDADEGFADHFELVEKNPPVPPAKPAIYAEDIAFEDLPIFNISDKKINVTYTYRANVDREIKFHLFDVDNNEVFATIISGLEGHGNNSVELNLPNILPNGVYSLEADIRPIGGEDDSVISSTVSGTTVGMLEYEKDAFLINMYPNPTNSTLHFKKKQPIRYYPFKKLCWAR